MALSDFLRGLGIKPSVAIGHSVGEVSALDAAEMLCANDAIFIVGQRATLLERLTEAVIYGMMATRATLDKTKEIAESTGCEVACINWREDIILAGHKQALSAASERLKGDGIKALPLDLSHGYHSQQMDSILDEYERIVEGLFSTSQESPSSHRHCRLLSAKKAHSMFPI
jgi:acyl transferase domain-containing protein